MYDYVLKYIEDEENDGEEKQKKNFLFKARGKEREKSTLRCQCT